MMVSMRDRGFAGGAIADDQLALAPANRNHRVNRHDTRLHRLTHAAALDHAGGNFFQRIKCLRLDVALAIERFPEGIDHATEQLLPDRNGEQATGRFCLVALGYLGGVTEQNRAHLSFLEVKGQPEDAAGKFDHLV